MEYTKYFSNVADWAKSNPIRRLTALINRPGIISFAGGVPSPETFPYNEIAEIAPENQLRLERIANIRTLREARTKLLHQLNALNLGLNIGVLGLHIITNTVIEPNPQFMHYVGITQVAAALGVASLKLHHRYYYGMPEED